MRILWMLPCLLAGALWADEAADRKAIDATIERLNFASERATAFAADADVAAEIRRLETAECNIPALPKVWSEVPSPRFTRPSVQFISPDVAVADVNFVRYTTVVKGLHTPVVAIMKRERSEWKIATLRVMAECGGELRLLPAAR